MLFALLVMFSGSWCQSVGAYGVGEMSHEIINILRFSLTRGVISPSLSPHKIHSHNKNEINGTKSLNIMCVRQQVSQRFDV